MDGWLEFDERVAADLLLADSRQFLVDFSMQSPGREVLIALSEYCALLSSSDLDRGIDLDLVVSISESLANALKRCSDKIRSSSSERAIGQLARLVKIVNAIPNSRNLSFETIERLLVHCNGINRSLDNIRDAIMSQIVPLVEIDSLEEVQRWRGLILTDSLRKYLESHDSERAKSMVVYMDSFQSTIAPGDIADAMEVILKSIDNQTLAKKSLQLLEQFTRHLEGRILTTEDAMNPHFQRIKNALIFHMCHSSSAEFRDLLFKRYDRLISLWPISEQLIIIMHSFEESPFLTYRTACLALLKQRCTTDEFLNDHYHEIMPRIIGDQKCLAMVVDSLVSYHMQLMNLLLHLPVDRRREKDITVYLKELDKWISEQDEQDVTIMTLLRTHLP